MWYTTLVKIVGGVGATSSLMVTAEVMGDGGLWISGMIDRPG